MKFYMLVFVILATVFLYNEYANAKEICHEENCTETDKSEELIENNTSKIDEGERDNPTYCHPANCHTLDKCEEVHIPYKACKIQGTACCHKVKEQFRTHCFQYDGTCMDSCEPLKMDNSIAPYCEGDGVCCITKETR